MNFESEKEVYEYLWDQDYYRRISVSKKMLSEYVNGLDYNPGDTVIDIGCGAGKGSKYILQNSKMNVVMLDFAENCLDQETRDLIDDDKLKFFIHDITEKFPVKARFGFCVDVMEHIQPELVDQTLKNIFDACDEVFFNIAMVEDRAGKEIGRKLHLTVRNEQWWLNKLKEFGATVLSYYSKNGSINIKCVSKNTTKPATTTKEFSELKKAFDDLQEKYETLEKKLENTMNAVLDHLIIQNNKLHEIEKKSKK